MDKNGNRIIIITASILLLVIVFIVYHFFYGSLSNKSIKYNNPEKLVEGYIESIINKNYAESIKYIYLPSESFVNKKDYESFIKTKYYYNDISKMKIDSINNDDSNTYNVSLSDSNGNSIKIDVEVIERTINDYRIDESDIYINNYLFSVPKNTTVYIDDYEVDKSLIAKENNNQDYYLLPAIASNEKTFKLVNKLATNETKVIPSESNDAYKFSIKISDDLKNRAYSFIKDTWNSMYNSYYNKENVSNVMKFFDKKYEENDVKEYYTKSFNKISTGLTSIGKYQNYKISSIIDKPVDPCVVVTDELIKVNFGYTLKWKWKYSGANSSVKMSMNRYSSIVLKVMGDSFVIYDVSDSGLFNYTSQYTRDF